MRLFKILPPPFSENSPLLSIISDSPTLIRQAVLKSSAAMYFEIL
jgi:hypothetical protein